MKQPIALIAVIMVGVGLSACNSDLIGEPGAVVTGMALDSATMAPLADVLVSVNDTTSVPPAAITDSLGGFKTVTFTLPRRLIFRKTGYSPKSVTTSSSTGRVDSLIVLMAP